MNEKTKIKVFLASPMDLENERLLFRDVIARINENEAASQNAEFELICWENNTRPGIGEDAQSVVNRQLRGNYDIFVCMFKSRVGTPTNRTISGTVEEYERARLKWLKNNDLEIMAYFFRCDDPGQDVRDLRAKMESKNADGVLCGEIKSAEDFEAQVYNHLSQFLAKHLSRLQETAEKEAAYSEKSAASVAFVCDSSVLLLQRSANSAHGPETWQLPGGKSEAGETPEMTAIREVREELSYNIKLPEQLVKIGTFSETANANQGSRLNMTLFIYKVNKKFKPKLNKESKAFEWVPLSCCDFGRKNLFRTNDRMLKAVWREIYLNSSFKGILDYMRDTSSAVLPTALSGISDHELNTAYALLNFLGITDISRGIVLGSETYGGKLLEEFSSMITDGESLFKNDENPLPSDSIHLSHDAIEQLKEIRANAFCSNKALISHLSCYTKIGNSKRNICDTLIFGKHNDKKYILLRWDFFANKYQFVGTGLESIKKNDNCDIPEDDMIAAVMNKRFPALKRYFDYVFITEYSSYHFSAGSVANDPLLREFNVKMAVLLINNRADTNNVCSIISSINKATEAKLSLAQDMDSATKKSLQYFVWCDLDELLADPTAYRGRRVSGFKDLKDRLGEIKIRHYITDNLLTTLDLPFDPQNDDDNLSKYLRG